MLFRFSGTTVMELCNVACSSVMPGGGTNLELALHCLHDAQGSVQVRQTLGTLHTWAFWDLDGPAEGR